MINRNQNDRHSRPKPKEQEGLSGEEIAYLLERADKSGYAWNTKGITGKDKEYEERDAADKVLSFLDLKYEKFVSEPNGKDTPPDVGVTLAEGKRIGIEMKELVSEKFRRLPALRREEERKLGLNPYEAFRAHINYQNPTPNHVLPWAIDEGWNSKTVSEKN